MDSDLCPESKTTGRRTGLITIKALLKGNALRRLDGADYRFCAERDCDVVYFDRAAHSIFRKSDIGVRVGAKEIDDPIPVCYCFEFAVSDLKRELGVRGTTGIPAIIAAEIKAGHCACEVRNPEGVCCLGEVSEAVRQIRRGLKEQPLPG